MDGATEHVTENFIASSVKRVRLASRRKLPPGWRCELSILRLTVLLYFFLGWRCRAQRWGEEYAFMPKQKGRRERPPHVHVDGEPNNAATKFLGGLFMSPRMIISCAAYTCSD